VYGIWKYSRTVSTRAVQPVHVSFVRRKGRILGEGEADVLE
jgi:hypothetical protein